MCHHEHLGVPATVGTNEPDMFRCDTCRNCLQNPICEDQTFTWRTCAESVHPVLARTILTADSSYVAPFSCFLSLSFPGALAPALASACTCKQMAQENQKLARYFVTLELILQMNALGSVKSCMAWGWKAPTPEKQLRPIIGPAFKSLHTSIKIGKAAPLPSSSLRLTLL